MSEDLSKFDKYSAAELVCSELKAFMCTKLIGYGVCADKRKSISLWSLKQKTKTE